MWGKLGDEIYRWTRLIDEKNPQEDLYPEMESLGPTQQGRLVHSWLQNNFEDLEDLKFENDVEVNGKTRTYDAYDGDFVYEFKTKYPHSLEDALLPIDEDIEQIDAYLEGTDTEYGVLVYIDRQDFDVLEYLIPRGYSQE